MKNINTINVSCFTELYFSLYDNYVIVCHATQLSQLRYARNRQFCVAKNGNTTKRRRC